jgi:hypothetical protein
MDTSMLSEGMHILRSAKLSQNTGLAIFSIGETQGGLRVKGSGEILITLACKDDIGTGTLCELLRPIDCTTEGIKSALHWLCLAHMSEILRLKDTTLDLFFADGNSPGANDSFLRQQRALARLDCHKDTCGDAVPRKLVEGGISKFVYSVYGAKPPCSFTVGMKEALELQRQYTGDQQDIEDISWLLSL